MLPSASRRVSDIAYSCTPEWVKEFVMLKVRQFSVGIYSFGKEILDHRSFNYSSADIKQCQVSVSCEV